MLLSCESFSIVQHFTVEHFSTFSCHAPLFVDIKLKRLSIPSECTCKKIKCKTIRWNEEFKDEVKNDLMVNAHKFEELFQNITEDGESIDGNVDNMNELLTDIFEKYTTVELDRTIQCEYCIG
jgi:hypothetical protein